MNQRLTVSILGTLPPIRGLSSYCRELAVALSEKCRVEFISFRKIYPAFLYPGGAPGDDNTYPALPATQIREKRHLTWYNPLSWLRDGRGAEGKILHAQWWSAPLFPVYLTVCACFKLKGKPVIFTVHNVLSHEHVALYGILSRILFQLGDHFIVHTEPNRQQMKALYHVADSKISVIPHGSLDFHRKRGIRREAVRREMGLSHENRVVLAFGAIRPYKGLDVAIEAFSKIVREVPEARLLIAGRLWEDWAPYSRRIRALNIQPFVITCLEYIPSGEVYRYFEAADLCIFPYRRFDSQSGAAAAAVSFRKPMIVSNAGGLPDLVADPRCIVPPGNGDALARAVIGCFKDPGRLAQMKAHAERVAEALSWPRIATETEAVYRRLLKPGPPF